MNSPTFTVERNMRGDLKAETDIELHRIDDTHTRVASITTMKGMNASVRCRVQVGIRERNPGTGWAGFSFAMGFGGPSGDYSAILAHETTRATEKAIARVHAAGLAAWPGVEAAVREKYAARDLIEA